ncbi:MAG: hypothetical protein ABIJ17_02475 [Patescibacteria group bacterium]
MNEFIYQKRWLDRRNTKKNMQEMFVYYMLKLKDLKAEKPIILQIDIYMKNKKIDPDNYGSMATKILLDSLVKINYIPNDNIEFVSEIHQRFFIDRKEPRLEITIK